MAELAAGITLHCLGLTIAGVMIWATAFVASSCAWNSRVTSAERTAAVTATATTAAADGGGVGIWAIALGGKISKPWLTI
jgi:hypothetical protein